MPLFCLTADYTAEAIGKLLQSGEHNRREAVNQAVEAAGGKIHHFYARNTNGPGAMVIFEAHGNAATALAGVAFASGSLRNIHLERLFTQEEIIDVRQRSAAIRSAYKPATEL